MLFYRSLATAGNAVDLLKCTCSACKSTLCICLCPPNGFRPGMFSGTSLTWSSWGSAGQSNKNWK